MSNPEDYLFNQEHMWCRLEADDHIVIGVSDHAQTNLGDVALIELPEPGSTIRQNESLGIIESAKVVTELIAPAGGNVVETNKKLADEPTMVNDAPYDEGWMLRVKLDSPDQLKELMNKTNYMDFIQE